MFANFVVPSITVPLRFSFYILLYVLLLFLKFRIVYVVFMLDVFKYILVFIENAASNASFTINWFLGTKTHRQEYVASYEIITKSMAKTKIFAIFNCLNYHNYTITHYYSYGIKIKWIVNNIYQHHTNGLTLPHCRICDISMDRRNI